MKLSILIPVYNTGSFLRSCLESCLAQDLILNDEYEIICINDGSTDNSKDILAEYEARGIRVVHQKNQGVSVARNHALTLAEGMYVWFVDSDDYIAVNILKTLMAYLEERQIECLKINYTKTVPEMVLEREQPRPITLQEVPSGNRFPKPGDFVWQFIVSKHVLQQHGIVFNPDMSFAEDSLWFFRIRYHGIPVMRISNVFYYYVERATSACHTINREKYEKSMFAMIESYRQVLSIPSLRKKTDIELHIYSCVQNLLFNALHYPRAQRDMLLNRLRDSGLYPFSILWRRFDLHSGVSYFFICSISLFFPFEPYYKMIWMFVRIIKRTK